MARQQTGNTHRQRFMPMALMGAGLAVVALTGCQKSDQPNDALIQKIDTLNHQLEAQAQQLDVMRRAILQHDSIVSRFEYTEFDPSAIRYFSLNNGVVSLVGQVTRISPQPNGNGSVVTLRVANNGGVTLFNPSFMAQWGTAIPTGEQATAEQLQQWRESLHSSEFHGQMQLAPGEWTELSVVLGNTSPDQLHYLRLTTLMDQIEFGGAPHSAPAAGTKAR